MILLALNYYVKHNSSDCLLSFAESLLCAKRGESFVLQSFVEYLLQSSARGSEQDRQKYTCITEFTF